MKFEHTNRHGFLIGLADFMTAGLLLLFWMKKSMHREFEEVLGHPIESYSSAYLKGIPNLFIYTLHWMAKIAEEMKAKAIELGLEGSYTSYRHMFGWNTWGLLLFGPAVATARFFDTLNRIEQELNHRNGF